MNDSDFIFHLEQEDLNKLDKTIKRKEFEYLNRIEDLQQQVKELKRINECFEKKLISLWVPPEDIEKCKKI